MCVCVCVCGGGGGGGEGGSRHSINLVAVELPQVLASNPYQCEITENTNQQYQGSSYH